MIKKILTVVITKVRANHNCKKVIVYNKQIKQVIFY